MKVVASVAYEKIREIGVGEGMNSKVFLANDPQLAGEIAVKEVPKLEFINHVDRYFAEAQAMYRTRHDNIVPVHYACETTTHVCIAMPFFKKGSFARMVEQGPAPASVVLSTGLAVLNGLAQIHLANFLHLDVKPSNVLVSDRGVPMISDFGQAREMSATGIARSSAIYYLGVPPEAYSGVVAIPSDIFQVGMLLYRAANGDPYFKKQWNLDHAKQKQATLAGRFPRRDSFLPHVPRRLRTVIRRALRVKPEERFQSAVEFSDALGRVPCELDWRTTVEADGYTWQCHRESQPGLLVRAILTGHQWRVEVLTVSAGVLRAKGRSVFWKSRLSWKDVVTHLDEVFENLR